MKIVDRKKSNVGNTRKHEISKEDKKDALGSKESKRKRDERHLKGKSGREVKRSGDSER